MAKLRTKSQRIQRALLAGAVVCLFLLQTLTFVVSQNGRLSFARGSADVFTATAAEICGEWPDDGGKSPAVPGHLCRHCILCLSGSQDSTLNAMALLATVFVLLSPQSDDAPAWLRHEEPTLWHSGFASSWQSRAPPVS